MLIGVHRHPLGRRGSLAGSSGKSESVEPAIAAVGTSSPAAAQRGHRDVRLRPRHLPRRPAVDRSGSPGPPGAAGAAPRDRVSAYAAAAFLVCSCSGGGRPGFRRLFRCFVLLAPSSLTEASAARPCAVPAETWETLRALGRATARRDPPATPPHFPAPAPGAMSRLASGARRLVAPRDAGARARSSPEKQRLSDEPPDAVDAYVVSAVDVAVLLRFSCAADSSARATKRCIRGPAPGDGR
jgi:hypothetical protein